MILRQSNILLSLSRIRGPHVRHLSSSIFVRKHLASDDYFITNEPGNLSARREKRRDEVSSLDSIISKRSLYLELSKYYHQNGGDKIDLEPRKSYKALKSFDKVWDYSENNIPSTGSLVEFISTDFNEVEFGVVLRGPSSRFYENHNKLSVLTAHNEIVKVAPQNITFHLYQVLRSSWIEEMDFTKGESQVSNPNRKILVSTLKQFINNSVFFSRSNQDQLQTCYSKFAKAYNIVAVTLPEIIESMSLTPYYDILSQSYFYQSSFMFGIHIGLVKSLNWYIPSYLPNQRETSIVSNESSNELAPLPIYYTNSLHNVDALNKLHEFTRDDKRIAEIGTFMSNLRKEQLSSKRKTFEDLDFHFNIWQGKGYKFLIDVMKYVIVYPHPLIISTLSTLQIFDSSEITPRSIHDYLKSLQIYDNEKNQLTDVHLSANIAGQPSSSTLAVSSVSDLESQSMVEDGYTKFDDMVPFLRGSKKYYKGHTIYGIPFTNTSSLGSNISSLGISLEKINSRKFVLNVHIPDIMTKLPPSSDLFHETSTFRNSMKSIKRLVDNGSLDIFSNKFLERLMFPHRKPKKSWSEFHVGDLGTDRQLNISSCCSCFTISFTYSKYDSNPFSGMSDKISVSFDDISDVVIKNLEKSQLEDTLLERNHISPFRLLIRRSQKDSNKTSDGQELDNDDIHNIKFIYHVMRSYYKVRNINGATEIHNRTDKSVTDVSKVHKELSFTRDTSNKEVLNTNLVYTGKSNSVESEFFINELEKFAAHAISTYCLEYNIPVFARYQSLINDSEIEEGGTQDKQDSVFVKHNNFLLPNFYASSFYQLLMSRDGDGRLSHSGGIISKNFLSRKQVDVQQETTSMNVPLGSKIGYVSICDVLNSYEAMFNQLQILFHKIAESNRHRDNFTNHMKTHSFLKRFGYNLNGPYPSSILKKKLRDIVNSDNYSEHIERLNKRFMITMYLEQHIHRLHRDMEAPNFYECIITYVGNTFEGKRLCKAYCVDLELEVELVVSSEKEVNIGTTIDRANILYLEPVSGTCVLKEFQIL